MLDFLRNLRLACMRKLCGKKNIRHQENFLSYGQCFLAVLFPGLRISRGIFNPFSVRYLWCRKQLTLASRQEDKLQLKIDRSLFIFLLRLFTLQKTEPSTKFSVQYNNCLITLSIVFEFYVMNCERLCYELHKFLMCGNHICMAVALRIQETRIFFPHLA